MDKVSPIKYRAAEYNGVAFGSESGMLWQVTLGVCKKPCLTVAQSIGEELTCLEVVVVGDLRNAPPAYNLRLHRQPERRRGRNRILWFQRGHCLILQKQEEDEM
jgi:hypothetical protein